LQKPTIIILAYNRLEPLRRLLTSLAAAYYPVGDINLIISIDKSKDRNIIKEAESFKWMCGKKEIITHPKHLGLVGHVFFAAGLSEKYENIIVLEDDLIVSPYYYMFAAKALAFYKNCSSIAGISLYGYSISESSMLTYEPIDDGSDVYYLQYPSSWGYCISHSHWKAFMAAFENKQLADDKSDPFFIKQWPRHSWKRFFVRYMLLNDKFFVYPRLSLTTNFADKGRNTPLKMDIFQVPIQLQEKSYLFSDFNESKSKYDVYFEILPDILKKLCTTLGQYNFIVDLQGAKDLRRENCLYTLTSKRSQNPIITFSSSMRPLINNVIFNIKGNELCFSLIKNVKAKPNAIHYGHAQFNHRYSNRLMRGRFSFLKYFTYYIKYELRLFFSKLFR